MKTSLLIILAATGIIGMPACTTGNFDPTPVVSAGVTYQTARIVDRHPERADDLAAAAQALDDLAAGVVNRETVGTALHRVLNATDPEERALIVLVAGYFPSGDAAVPVSEKVAALARSIAAAIRLGLPASK